MPPVWLGLTRAAPRGGFARQRVSSDPRTRFCLHSVIAMTTAYAATSPSPPPVVPHLVSHLANSILGQSCGAWLPVGTLAARKGVLLNQ